MMISLLGGRGESQQGSCFLFIENLPGHMERFLPHALPNPASDTLLHSFLPHGLGWCFFGLICVP